MYMRGISTRCGSARETFLFFLALIKLINGFCLMKNKIAPAACLFIALGAILDLGCPSVCLSLRHNFVSAQYLQK